MRIVFFGTPSYVLPILSALHKKFMGQNGNSAICAVVTKSPKPTGRNQQVDYSPVDKWAHTKNIPVYYDVEKLINDGVKADIGILESYGSILTSDAINHFPFGIVNAHPSLLPKYRGASPAQATILNGDEVSGGTIIKLDKFIDHGKVIAQFKEDVLPDDTAETLRVRIFDRSVEILINLIEPYLKNKIKLTEQDDTKSVITFRINKEDAFISPKHLNLATQGKGTKTKWVIPFIKDFSMVPSPQSLERFIRAMSPWPVAWTKVKILSDKDIKILRLKILKAHIQPTTNNLQLDLVQLEGKNEVSWEEFKHGYPKAELND